MMRNVLLIIVGYFLARGFIRFWRVRQFIKQQKAEFENQQNRSDPHSNEGDINVISKKSPTKESGDQGDYVDFEEVQD